MPKLRMGMVGGGEGAFIGQLHRMAAAQTRHPCGGCWVWTDVVPAFP